MALDRPVAPLTSSSTVVPSDPCSRLAASSRLSPLIERPPIFDDQLAGLDAGLPRGAAPDHADQAESFLVES